MVTTLSGPIVCQPWTSTRRVKRRTRSCGGNGFEIETIINTRIAKASLSIVEVPSYEFNRIHGESNLNTWRDGYRVLHALLIERVTRRGKTSVRPGHFSDQDPRESSRALHPIAVQV
jgi:hypothetical protein